MSAEVKESMMELLVFVATRTRVFIKMSRVGVATKLLLTLSLGYVDVLTDLLVSKSYYDAKDFSTAYATMGFAVLAIVNSGSGYFCSVWEKGEDV